MRTLKHKPAITEASKLTPLIQTLIFVSTKSQSEAVLKEKIFEIKSSLREPRPHRKPSHCRILVLEILLLYTIGKWQDLTLEYESISSLIKELLASQVVMDIRLGSMAIGILSEALSPAHSTPRSRSEDYAAPLIHLLVHEKSAVVSIALTALMNIPFNESYDEFLFEEVADLANPIANQDSTIRVKSLALMAKIATFRPDIAPFNKWIPRLSQTIQLEKHPAVLLGLVRLTSIIFVNDTESISAGLELQLAEILTTLLGITINEEIPAGYSFGGCPTPFLVMKTFSVIAQCSVQSILSCVDRLGPLIEHLVHSLSPESNLKVVPKSLEMKTAVVLSVVDIFIKVPTDTFEPSRALLVTQLVNMATKHRQSSPIIHVQAMRNLNRIIQHYRYKHIEEFHLLQFTPRSDPNYSYYLSLMIESTTSKKNYPESVSILDQCAEELRPFMRLQPQVNKCILSSPDRVLKQIYRDIFNITLYASSSITSIVDQFMILFDLVVEDNVTRNPILALEMSDEYLRAMIRLIVGYDFRERQKRDTPVSEATECSSDVHFQLYCLKTIVERLKGLDDRDLLAINEPVLHFFGYLLGEFGHCAKEELPITASVSLLSKLVHAELRKISMKIDVAPSTFNLLLSAMVKIGLRTKDDPKGPMVFSIVTVAIQKAIKEYPNARIKELSILLHEGTKEDIEAIHLYPREFLLEDIGDEPGAQAKMLADLCLIRRRCDSVPATFKPTYDAVQSSPEPPTPDVKHDEKNLKDGLLIQHWPLHTNTILRTALLGRGLLMENDFAKISLINIQMRMGTVRLVISFRIHDQKDLNDEPLMVRLRNFSVDAGASFDLVESTGLEPSTLTNGENTNFSLKLRLNTQQDNPGSIPLIVKCLFGNSAIPRLVTAPLPLYFFSFYAPTRGDFKDLWATSKSINPKHSAKISLSSAHLKGVWKVDDAIEFLKRLCVSFHFHVEDYQEDRDRFFFHGVTSVSTSDLIIMRVCDNPLIPGGVKIGFREMGRNTHSPLFARAIEGLCTFGPTFNIN